MSYRPLIAVNMRSFLAFVLLIWVLANSLPLFLEPVPEDVTGWNGQSDELDRAFQITDMMSYLPAVTKAFCLLVAIACVFALPKSSDPRISLRKPAFIMLVCWFVGYCLYYFDIAFASQMRPMSDPSCFGAETPGPMECDVDGEGAIMLAMPTIDAVVAAFLLTLTWFAYKREGEY